LGFLILFNPSQQKIALSAEFLHPCLVVSAARVLVIDDEPLFLRAVSKTLSKQGYDVLAAAGPCQALEIIKYQRPMDVVLSDVQMPEMRGTDLVREIARVSPQTAVILMTGAAVHPADLPKCVPVLCKPFTTLDLFVLLTTLCQAPSP
jgi:CheY-like chemotaxis protein